MINSMAVRQTQSRFLLSLALFYMARDSWITQVICPNPLVAGKGWLRYDGPHLASLFFTLGCKFSPPPFTLLGARPSVPALSRHFDPVQHFPTRPIIPLYNYHNFSFKSLPISISPSPFPTSLLRGATLTPFLPLFPHSSLPEARASSLF